MNRIMLAESQDEEQIIARVAAIDIGKAELVCCVRVPAEGNRKKRLQEVSTHSTMSRSLTELANHLVDLRIERVVMEATSDYWKPVFYLLEAHGLEPWLVNARDVRHLPGRPKTDVLTELTGSTRENRGRRRFASARFCSHGQRRERSAGTVRAGGAAVGFAGGNREPLRTVSAG
ncbi:IS110 family transposase [Pseudarthrobacter sp. H2]|uniref:IS110 family transposase n=1 Tax=Pseudarthrobacter sp. H2 TaxID=3418415 RepID=UPI003CF0160D